MQKTWDEIEKEYEKHIEDKGLATEMIKKLRSESKAKDFSIACLCITVIIMIFAMRKR